MTSELVMLPRDSVGEERRTDEPLMNQSLSLINQSVSPMNEILSQVGEERRSDEPGREMPPGERTPLQLMQLFWRP